MKARDLAGRPSAQTGTTDPVISEALKKDPKEVARIIAEIVARCRADGRYT